MRRLLFVALAGLLCIGIAGREAVGRLALRVGLPEVAAPLLPGPAPKGLALYRLGDYRAADLSFAAAGRTETFNRGLSLAALGEHELAVAYFEAMLFANPADAEARAMRDLVASMIVPVVGEGTVPGRVGGAGGEEGTGQKTRTLIPGVTRSDLQRPFVTGGTTASEAWLATIGDDPGTYLKLRLKTEYDRRTAAGVIRPEAADPW